MGLRRDGASRGATVGFLIATPQTGVDSILVAGGLLGWPFALFKVGAALLTGVVGGTLADALPEGGGVLGAASTHRGGRSWRDGLAHSVDLVRMIWRWLVFGVVLSAAITAYVPPETFAGLAGEGLVAGVALALLISLPLYVCATASVPIAAALVASGMPTGAALVFLMAGPATNLATVGAVRKAFGNAVLAAYVGTLIVGSVAFGFVYEAVFGTLDVSAAHIHGEHSWLAVFAGALLTVGMVYFAAEELWAWTRPAVRDPVTVRVDGMTCGSCAARLERTLRAAEGVVAASVSFETKSAAVDGLDRAAVTALVEGAGFAVGS